MSQQSMAAIFVSFGLWISGCCHPEITAVSLSPCNQCKNEGIPFYLPKPLLVVAKNFRYIEESKVGLTDSAPIPGGFDDQAKYADLNARTSFVQGAPVASYAAPTGSTGNTSGGNPVSSPPRLHSDSVPVTPFVAPTDGLSPATFYTYQIVFVPDMTQKYGLKIRGGPGEIRAAMNLVNGWQFTGVGPFYMKDSSTAQNIVASGIFANLAGQGVADVITSAADFSKAAGTKQTGDVTMDNPAVQNLSRALQALPMNVQPMELSNFAEIHVYEPNVTPYGEMTWTEIVNLNFNRQYLGTEKVEATAAAQSSTAAPGGPLLPGSTRQTEEIEIDPAAAQALTHALGTRVASSLLRGTNTRQSGEVTTVGGQQPVEGCGGTPSGDSSCATCSTGLSRLLPFGKARRPRLVTDTVVGAGNVISRVKPAVPAAVDPNRTDRPVGPSGVDNSGNPAAGGLPQ